jgi:2,4-dienoyl-CoA reductase-like NADH-dependent reductase (Old Yellow Enzyme family)
MTSVSDVEAHLFTPIQIGCHTLKNRIVVSPMCQYSSEDGFASDWHLVHLGSRAAGGAALVFTEATAVEAEGRISPQDLGIWKDEHIPMLARIAGFVEEHGALPGIQLAHAGRKASTQSPSMGNRQIAIRDGGWQAVAPSPIAFRPGDEAPAALSKSGVRAVIEAFAAAVRRAQAAGFRVIEIHGAHGYLIHEFLSPLSNQRDDEYGGPFENRIRFLSETVQAVRAEWPVDKPLFVRISATDWVEGGWSIEDSVRLAAHLKGLGLDLIDCSSGGNALQQQIPVGPGYQVPFARRIKQEVGIRTGAVGMITEAGQADRIIRQGDADVVLLAREMLRDPYFPLHAAQVLGAKAEPPVQYARAY